jgi:hypothetical protein
MRFVVGATSIQTVCIGICESMGKALYATYYYFYIIILVIINMYLRVRGSARYPPMSSHLRCASTQFRLTAVSRNLMQPSTFASNQPSKIIEGE